MIAKAIEKILSLACVEEFNYDGKCYTDKPVNPVLDPMPQTLGLNTLDGLVDYIKTDDWQHVESAGLIHVVDFNMVCFMARLSGNFLQRAKFARADSSPCTFNFGYWFDVENFVINMQAQFVQDDATAIILKIVGNLKDYTTCKVADDGITQTVVVKAGIVRGEYADVPNPVTLRPYRTFLEIDQPASDFVFRFRRGKEGTLPTCALFEAGGGWKLEAIGRIRDYLGSKLPDVTIIA